MKEDMLNNMEKNEKYIRKRRMEKIMAASIISLCLIIFFALTLMVEAGSTDWLDDPVRNFIYSLRNDGLTVVMKIITYMGNWQTITALCIALLLIKSTRLTYGIPISVGAILVTVLNKIIKSVVQRPRPDDVLFLIEQGGWSFPSGHSITGMCVFAMFIYLIRANVKNRRIANILTVLLIIPMIFIGISRIYLGVHYPTDVMAGWCLGLSAAIVLLIPQRARMLQNYRIN